MPATFAPLDLPFRSIPAMLARSGRERAEHPAIIHDEQVTTWQALCEQAEAVAGWLQHKAGVQPGDRVLLYAQNSPRFIAAFHGILRADAVAVLASPMHLTDEVRHTLDDSGAGVVIADPDLRVRLQPLAGRPIDHLLVLGDVAAHATDTGVQATPWHTLLRQPRPPGPCTVQADDACLIAYTSGSTGRPKGCVHTHRSLMTSAMTIAHWRGNRPDSVILGTSPLFHLMGLAGSIMVPAYLGCTLVLMGRWDVAQAMAAIARHRVTNWGVMPTVVVDLMAYAEQQGLDLGSLELLSGGGGRMPQADLDRLRDRHGVEFMECYGMTETAGTILGNPREALRRNCLGVATYGAEARIIDPDTLQELPVGETGEIVVRGGQVMQAYWRNPEATTAAFVTLKGQRFLRTGDLGRQDAHGCFYMVDRLKRMVSVSGFKVWPAEVEEVLQSHPAVVQACVVAAPDARRGEVVKAYVVARDPIREDDLIDWLRVRVASYKCPKTVEFMPRLPLAATGKVDWRSLQEAARAQAPPPPQ